MTIFKIPGIKYVVRQKSEGKEAGKALVASFLRMPGMTEVRKAFMDLPENLSLITRLNSAVCRASDPEIYGEMVMSLTDTEGYNLDQIKSYVTLNFDTTKLFLKIEVSRKSLDFANRDKDFAKAEGWEIVEGLDDEW